MALGWKVMLPLALLNLLVTGADRAGDGDEGSAMLSILRTHLGRLPARVPQAGDGPVSRRRSRYLPPRWRGRIILSRDPDGGERCVACYLCAVACPVDCIALQATEDETGRRYPEFFRINFSRCIFCGYLRGGLPDLRHPAHAGLRDERVPPARTWSTRRRTC